MAAVLAVFNVISVNYSETELVSKLEASINSFTALPHRLELVRTIDGVRFVNDSKATNTDSVKYALSAFNEGIHLIIGGYDKGEDYSLLSLLIAERVKGLYLIGATRDKMSKQFSTFDSIMESYDDLESAVKSAYSKAKGNEVVLLAPACASFDMFADYEHRGEVFRSIVRGLR
jgi:UDP-N-acetylmuramoylalanine--D-glutamate ligase